jgi:hypothetical protein
MDNGIKGIKMKQTTKEIKDKLDRKTRDIYKKFRAKVTHKTNT